MKDGRKELSESEKEGLREGGREMGRHGLIQAIGSCLKVHTCVLTNTKDGLVSLEMRIAECMMLCNLPVALLRKQQRHRMQEKKLQVCDLSLAPSQRVYGSLMDESQILTSLPGQHGKG